MWGGIRVIEERNMIKNNTCVYENVIYDLLDCTANKPQNYEGKAH